MLRSVVVAALLVGATAVWADTIEDKAALCGACHGEKGIPEDPTTPIIWGQNAGYLYLQFRDFQKGARKDYRMTPIAQYVVKGRRAGARRIFRRQTLAQHRRAERHKGGEGRRDGRHQFSRLHELPSGAVSGRFVRSPPRRPETRLSRQDDDGFPDRAPRQQSRHVRPHDTPSRPISSLRSPPIWLGFRVETPIVCWRQWGLSPCERRRTCAIIDLATKRRTKQSDRDIRNRGYP